MSIHLIRDLDALHRDILKVCALVEELIHEAVDSLTSLSPEKAAELSERDDEINAWEVRIEEECMKILALHQPVAADLRRIVAVLKISAELERVGDLGVHIAERAYGLGSCSELAVPDKLSNMAAIAIDMLHRSIDAYVELDSQVARQVCRDDEGVDQLNREIIDQLSDVMRNEPNNVDAALHMFSASRHIERIADHATNIAESVVYLVEGEIIRHQSEIEEKHAS